MSLRELISELEKIPADDERFPHQVHKIKRRKKEGADAWKVRLLLRLRKQRQKEEIEDHDFLNRLDDDALSFLLAQSSDLSPFTLQFEHPLTLRVRARDLLLETFSSHPLRAEMCHWVGETFASKIAEAMTCDLECSICPTAKLINCASQNKTARKKDGICYEYRY